MNRHLLDLFNSNKLDEIMNQFSVEEIANQLDFKNAIKLSWRFLFNDWQAHQQFDFGLSLLISLKKIKSTIWDSDWRYDALLGVAWDFIGMYDERYEAFKSAYDKAKIVKEDDNPVLLTSLARCYRAPGIPPISQDEALALVMRAMKNKISKDGASALSAIYYSKRDMENHEKWSQLAEELEEEWESGADFYPRFLWDEEIYPINKRQKG